MAIVLDRSHRWRIVAAHVFLICLCALVIFPFLVVISISLRPGNFATGSILIRMGIRNENPAARHRLTPVAWFIPMHISIGQSAHAPNSHPQMPRNNPPRSLSS